MAPVRRASSSLLPPSLSAVSANEALASLVVSAAGLAVGEVLTRILFSFSRGCGNDAGGGWGALSPRRIRLSYYTLCIAVAIGRRKPDFGRKKMRRPAGRPVGLVQWSGCAANCFCVRGRRGPSPPSPLYPLFCCPLGCNAPHRRFTVARWLPGIVEHLNIHGEKGKKVSDTFSIPFSIPPFPSDRPLHPSASSRNITAGSNGSPSNASSLFPKAVARSRSCARRKHQRQRLTPGPKSTRYARHDLRFRPRARATVALPRHRRQTQPQRRSKPPSRWR